MAKPRKQRARVSKQIGRFDTLKRNVAVAKHKRDNKAMQDLIRRESRKRPGYYQNMFKGQRRNGR